MGDTGRRGGLGRPLGGALRLAEYGTSQGPCGGGSAHFRLPMGGQQRRDGAARAPVEHRAARWGSHMHISRWEMGPVAARAYTER